MKQAEFLRLIQEIGCILQLSAPTISHIISIYKKFVKSDTHQFKQEIVITACFYLVGKMVEDQRRIRDVLVIISVVTKLYKYANSKYLKQLQEDNININGLDPVQYLSLSSFKEKDADFFHQLVPKMNDEQYLDWKTQVLQAEQHLLRIINYNLQTYTYDFYKILLNYLKIFNFEPAIRQLVFDIYQDTFFVDFLNELDNLTILKASIFLGVNIYRQYCEDVKLLVKISEDFFKKEWWENFMQLEMLNYYEQNDSFPI